MSFTSTFPRQRSLLSVLVLLVLAPLLTACGYNTIPTAEENAKAKWSAVLNQYQRRADLIPNLVETVKGYASHEAQTLEAVVEARAKATQVQINVNDLTDPAKVKAFQDSQAGLTGALGRLLAVAENYPDLKANQNFLSLQNQLEGTENRIAVARGDYIQAVQDYNLTLKTFPSLMWNWWFGKSEFANFTADASTQQPPTVNFGTQQPAPAPSGG